MKLPSGRLYLDCNATTPLAGPVAEVLARAQEQAFGNASSAYLEGRESRATLDEARGHVAALLGCEADEVIFTGSATEANHLAMTSAARAAGHRRRVLLSAIEHPAVYDQRDALESAGFMVEDIPVTPAGTVDLGRLEALLADDVAVVCVMAAHNETGVLQPVDEVGRLCERHGAWFHCDAVQALGKVSSPWVSARPHTMAAAAHKLYGPKGIGALAVRRGTVLSPVLVGGGQEGGRRSSTEAVPLAAAFGNACELALQSLGAMDGKATLRNGMEEVLAGRWGAVIHGRTAPRLPNTSFFSIPGAPGPQVARALDELGVAVSTGSACHAGQAVESRVLGRMGVPGELQGCTLRVSLGRDTTAGHVEAFCSALAQALEKVAKHSDCRGKA